MKISDLKDEEFSANNDSVLTMMSGFKKTVTNI